MAHVFEDVRKIEAVKFENREENVYCAKCGAPLNADTFRPATKNQSSNQQKLRWVLLLWLLFFLQL
jgi:hypothetical protein